MKKLTLTTNNANDSVQLTITNVMPHVNGLTGLCSITLTYAMQIKLREDLNGILSTGTI